MNGDAYDAASSSRTVQFVELLSERNITPLGLPVVYPYIRLSVQSLLGAIFLDPNQRLVVYTTWRSLGMTCRAEKDDPTMVEDWE